MTTELQRAMAQYEEARIRYKKAVLASLNGESSGDAIRQSIVVFQKASAELRRLTGPTRPAAVIGPVGEATVTRMRAQDEQSPFPGWAFVRRLLSTA
jgi:hypothetical protein